MAVLALSVGVATAQMGLAVGGVYAEPAGTPRYALAVGFPIPFFDHALDVVPYGEYSNGKWKRGNGASPSFYSTGIDFHVNLPALAVARPYVGIGIGALGTDAQSRVALNLKGGLYLFTMQRRFFPYVQAAYRLAGEFDEPNLFDVVSVQVGARIALGSAY